MKSLITALVFLIAAFGHSQSKNLTGTITSTSDEVKVESLTITVKVDSVEDIESTFKIEDIKEILEDSRDDEQVSFKIICNGPKKSNGEPSSASYMVEGNTNNKQKFLRSVEVIRATAINYYKN